MNRILDIIIACLIIVFMLPLIAMISLAIKLDSPGPVFCRADPLSGKGSTPVEIIKFRTTLHEAGTRGPVPRMTRVGRFLYLTRAEKLPLLFNVVRGDLRLSEARALAARS